MECVIDAREQSLITDCRHIGSVRTEGLPVGDILITHEKTPRLLIERKTVQDLVASLRDGRYHDQRLRWKEFQTDHPTARIAVWIEGDLMSTIMDETIRYSLVNSLMRLQSVHGIIVCQWTSRRHLVKGLELVMRKMTQDPTHLLPKEEGETPTCARRLDLGSYKKTQATPDIVWMSVLTLVPGITTAISNAIIQRFPSLSGFIDAVRNDRNTTLQDLCSIQISTKRRLGKVVARRICDLLCPSTTTDDTTSEHTVNTS